MHRFISRLHQVCIGRSTTFSIGSAYWSTSQRQPWQRCSKAAPAGGHAERQLHHVAISLAMVHRRRHGQTEAAYLMAVHPRMWAPSAGQRTR